MIHRSIARLVQERLATYPAVALLGPRQSGKTTLAKSLDGVYFDLEQPRRPTWWARTAIFSSAARPSRLYGELSL